MISHLQYADDTIMFCPPNMEFLANIKKTLVLFHLASGLKVNFHKSSISGLNISDLWIECAAKQLLCKKGSLPLTYLGLPIGGLTSRIASWEPIIKKMEKKLTSWRGSLLSIRGRVTLIKSSLTNLPLYYMSLYPIPQAVIKKIISIQRQFLWSGSMKKNAMSLVKWETLQLPRKLGGLSLGNILHRNLSLMFKWLWRYFCEPEAMWRNVIQCKYKYPSSFRIQELKPHKQGGPWKSICASILKHEQSKELALKGIRCKIGNGENSFFWKDIL